MEKVKCIECGSIGYTASPESTKCERCGGSLEISYHDYIFKGEDHNYSNSVVVAIRRMSERCSGGVR